MPKSLEATRWRWRASATAWSRRSAWPSIARTGEWKMRVALHCLDDVVHIDGRRLRTDWATLREGGISAVQWYGEKGEVEYIGHQQPNEAIEDFEPLRFAVERAEQFPEPEPMTPEEHRRF